MVSWKEPGPGNGALASDSALHWELISFNWDSVLISVK